MILKLNEIGDGLFFELFHYNKRLVTDFGSQQDIDKDILEEFSHSLHSTDFLLSHFHKDHYSGLYDLWDRSFQTKIERVYYPLLPRKKVYRDFLKAILALNVYLLGDGSGSMECDLINLIHRINKNKSFEFHPIAQGSFVDLHGKAFRVIWPPKVIDETLTKSVKKAVDKFEDELKKNKLHK